MIRLADKLWIGDSTDEIEADLSVLRIKAILNVAQDLQPTRGWAHGIEYAHVGLIDGPGNVISAYYGAVATLTSLLTRHNVMVCCHTYSRSMAVSLMYLNATSNRGWDEWLCIIEERISVRLPIPNDFHREAFGKMDWVFLKKLVEQS